MWPTVGTVSAHLHPRDDITPAAGGQVAVQLLPKSRVPRSSAPEGASPPTPHCLILRGVDSVSVRNYNSGTESASAINLASWTHLSVELMELYFPGCSETLHASGEVEGRSFSVFHLLVLGSC